MKQRRDRWEGDQSHKMKEVLEDLKEIKGELDQIKEQKKAQEKWGQKIDEELFFQHGFNKNKSNSILEKWEQKITVMKNDLRAKRVEI